jgi:hypothetical protein
VLWGRSAAASRDDLGDFGEKELGSVMSEGEEINLTCLAHRSATKGAGVRA